MSRRTHYTYNTWGELSDVEVESFNGFFQSQVLVNPFVTNYLNTRIRNQATATANAAVNKKMNTMLPKMVEDRVKIEAPKIIKENMEDAARALLHNDSKMKDIQEDVTQKTLYEAEKQINIGIGRLADKNEDIIGNAIRASFIQKGNNLRNDFKAKCNSLHDHYKSEINKSNEKVKNFEQQLEKANNKTANATWLGGFGLAMGTGSVLYSIFSKM